MKLCLQVLSKLTGVTCSKSEKTDRQTLSLACLSYLSLPNNVNPVSPFLSSDAALTGAYDSGYQYKEMAVGNEDANVLGPFLPRGPGSSSGKEGETSSLGLGVCTAVCALIKQVSGHIALLKKSKPFAEGFEGNGERDKVVQYGDENKEGGQKKAALDNKESKEGGEKEDVLGNTERVEDEEENMKGGEKEDVLGSTERVEDEEENMKGGEKEDVLGSTESVEEREENNKGGEKEDVLGNTERVEDGKGNNKGDEKEHVVRKKGDEADTAERTGDVKENKEGEEKEDVVGNSEEDEDIRQECPSMDDTEESFKNESLRTEKTISEVEFNKELKMKEDMKVLLLAGCSAIESIVLSHFSHRSVIEK